MKAAPTARRDLWIGVALAAAFVIVNGLLLAFAAEGRNLQPDSFEYIRLAEVIRDAGGLPPGEAMFRQPGYSILLALAMAAGTQWMTLAIVAQAAILLATALLARRLAERLLPGYGWAVAALVALNPLALLNVHLILNDTVYAALFTAAMLAGVMLLARPTWPGALALGALLGLCAWLRLEPQFLVYALPLLLVALALLRGDGRRWRRYLACGVAAQAAALVVVAPLMLHNRAAGAGLAFDNGRNAVFFLLDNMGLLRYYQSGQPYAEARLEPHAWAEAFRDAHADICRPRPGRACNRALRDAALARLFAMPPAVIARAWSIAVVSVYGGAWSGEVIYLLGYDDAGRGAPGAASVGGLAANWLRRLGGLAPGPAVITVATVGFVMAVRVLGLVGIVVLARRRQWWLLGLIGGLCVYVSGVHLFGGALRYRLPLEPLLFVLTAYGIDGLRTLWGRR